MFPNFGESPDLLHPGDVAVRYGQQAASLRLRARKGRAPAHAEKLRRIDAVARVQIEQGEIPSDLPALQMEAQGLP